MDKSCISSADDCTTTTASSTTTNNNNNRDQFLRSLNKSSHKISKPLRRPGFDYQPPQPQPQPQSLPQQHQPPVYNINKNDFRDVVQKLTGSPAHERFSTPPPIQPPKPPSSRLQRIRPPPLAQINYRPPPLLNDAVPPQQPPCPANVNPNIPSATGAVGNSGNFGRAQRPVAPLSPLPPFPAVHGAAESPISAYMRFLQTSSSSSVDSDPKRFSGLSPLAPLVSPKWNNHAQAPQPPQYQLEPLPPPPQQNLLPSPTSASMGLQPFPMPSPLPFGCFPSPRSPYALLSPSLLFSPSTAGQFGFQQLPLSPTLPVPSPRWKDH